MCFSAAASFSASGILLTMGLGSISKITNRSQVVLAGTPLLFSIQQLSEGLLWLSLVNSSSLNYQQISTYIFAIFGQLVWPIWVPLANLLIEKQKSRRRILTIILGVGIAISAYLLVQTMSHPIIAEIKDHHIHYIFGYTNRIVDNFNLTYLIPTVLAHFVSSFKRIQLLGALTLISFIVSKFYFPGFVFSVWCYYAAILSAGIFFIIRSIRKEESRWSIQL